MRELRVEDALLYLDQVKMEFGDRPHIYNEFLDIMKTFKTHQIDTPGVIRRVSDLFHSNKKLVLGFNTFLPEGYKIELPEDGNGPPVAVYRAPGETITHVLSGPSDPPPAQQPAAAAGVSGYPAGLQGQPLGPQGFGMRAGALAQHSGLGGGVAQGATAGFGRAAAGPISSHLQQGGHLGHGVAHPAVPAARAGMPGFAPEAAPAPNPAVPPHAGSGGTSAAPAQKPAAQPANQPPGMEFDHAINYVTTIKKRFANEPETYKKFLEILHTYQKEQRGIKEVLEEVSTLFSEHPDLLKEFTFFLPDAVQAEAKVQLEAAAMEAEARKIAREQAAQQQQQQQQHPQDDSAAETTSVTRPLSNPIPFGATMGRSREREHEIFRSVVYGAISFKPVRPPRKNQPTVAQAAAKKGRPDVLPRVEVPTNTAETEFFEQAKKHLNRKELAADRPSATRVRHTPYQEFLKCLHMYAAGILNKDELLLLLRGLFMQGHAPKSGINVGGGASNPKIANDAQKLIQDLEEILVGRGPYAIQIDNLKGKNKCGAKRARHYDFGDAERVTPSYHFLPEDFLKDVFYVNSGQSPEEKLILNSDAVCVPLSSSMPGINSPEDYDCLKVRRNPYEEAMFRIEEERFEVDMAIERNALAMRQVEPIAEEVAMLRETEEKDGQPIGRLQYKFKPKTLNSIQINAIGRIYGDKGDEVLEFLARNPLGTIPIIYQRLRQKDQEWRKQKSDLLARWRAMTEMNYEGSRDVMGYKLKKDIDKSLSDVRLLEECKKARSFCSSLEKRSGSSINFGLSSPDRSAVLYEPYGVVELKPESTAHKLAVKLLSRQLGGTANAKASQDLLSEFLVPFFEYPIAWLTEGVVDHDGGDGDIVTPPLYEVGQQVRTSIGNGQVVEYLDGKASGEPRYRVSFPMGTGYIRSERVLNALSGGPDAVANMEEESDEVHLDQKFKLLFGTESIYLFVRLYTSLVSLLHDIDVHVRDNPSPPNPKLSYYDPMNSQEEDKEKQVDTEKFDFDTLISKLQSLMEDKINSKGFESFCRRLAPDLVHKMASLPRLIERAADMLKQTANEGFLPELLENCQFTGANPVALREKCLTITSDAAFRIQYNVANGRLYFSFLPESEALSTIAGDNEDGSDDDPSDGAMEDGDIDSDDDDDGIMDVEDEEEDLRQVKRAKLK